LLVFYEVQAPRHAPRCVNTPVETGTPPYSMSLPWCFGQVVRVSVYSTICGCFQKYLLLYGARASRPQQTSVGFRVRMLF